MSTDDEADDEAGGGGPPLPPEDRLWRHPSELAAAAGPDPAGRVISGPVARWPVALVAAAVGAVLCGGALAATGNLSGTGTRAVVQKVALTPVVSSPALQGATGVDALAHAAAPTVARLLIRTPTTTVEACAVVVRDDGLLYTSAHAVAGATAIAVVLADGRRFDGRLVGADLLTDVAVVSIDAHGLPVAVLGASATLDVGATIVALGASPGTDALGAVVGVVRGIDQRLDVGTESMHGMIQTDAAVERAWWGGPLLDANGAVIGITTGLDGGATSQGYATPIDLVREIAEQLTAWGVATHAWLGIEGTDAPDTPDGTAAGVLVRSVAALSPAAEAGLGAGDIVTEIDDERVTSSSALVVMMLHHHPGDVVELGYWRDGRRHTARVTIGTRP